MHKLHELTPCQRQYAEEHINLVYKFLSVKELPANEYYDLIIFGYLAAVQEYDERPELSKFSFTTIAWRKLSDCLCEYFTYLNRQKRKAVTVEECISLSIFASQAAVILITATALAFMLCGSFRRQPDERNNEMC